MGTTPTIYDTNWFSDADKSTPQKGTDPASRSSILAARELLAKFKTGTAQAFTKLDRADIANDLDWQLRSPDSFRQRQSPFCGIAAFVRFWARDNPVAYLKLAIDLFERGAGRLESAGKHTGQVLNPSSELKGSAALHDMPQVDWMVMASIREALNNDFNYAHYKNVFAMTGGTTLPRIQAEFRSAGYVKVVTNSTNTSLYQRLTQAGALYQKNWRVILEIQPWVLKPTVQAGMEERKSKHTHAVGLDSEIVITTFNGKIMVQPFEVWSWAQIMTVPGWKTPLPIEAFAGCFNYVAGKY